MSSMLAKYRQMEEDKKRMEAQLNEMAPVVKAHTEFLDEIKARAKDLGLSNDAIAQDLAPHLFVSQASEPKKRRARRTKIYTNPSNGEIVQTKGGNHKVLKEWKEKYGAETVESWATLEA